MVGLQGIFGHNGRQVAARKLVSTPDLQHIQEGTSRRLKMMPKSPKGNSRNLTKIEMLYALHIEKHMMELARAKYQLSSRYIARVFQICSM